jgi:hypothetical protein
MKPNCNKLVLRFSIAVLLALSASNFSSASGRTRETTKRRLTARVVSVDYKNRTILVREFDGRMTTVIVPKGLQLNLSHNSPTMGRGHTLVLDTAVPGMIIDAYVLTTAKVTETAKAAPNSLKP